MKAYNEYYKTYNEGYKAYGEDKSLDENPYKSSGHERDQWHDGWNDAEDKNLSEN